MQIRSALAAFVALSSLAACTASNVAARASATHITYEVSSWGYTQELWTISATGEATLEAPPVGSEIGTPTTLQSFTVSAADFERVRAALAPAERLIETGVECERAFTDAPSGRVTWRRPDGAEATVSFYTGCRPNPDLEFLFDHTQAANRIFHQVTRAQR